VRHARAVLVAAVEQQDGAATLCARGGPVAVEQRFAVVRLEMVFFGSAWSDVCH
jgi:hypothetical protein